MLLWAERLKLLAGIIVVSALASSSSIAHAGPAKGQLVAGGAATTNLGSSNAQETNISKQQKHQLTTPRPTAPLAPTTQAATGAADERPEDDLGASASHLDSLRSPQTTASAGPSVTSVHQVWTSSSSGSLSELSPEIISKLRNDVPFLAAYALRPRLVGAGGQSEPPIESAIETSYTSASQLTHQAAAPSGRPNESPSEALSSGSDPTSSLPLTSAGSSPQRSVLSSSSSSLVPRLGDFSEFKVETSSLSKSEHHHKRKTVLKKQDRNKKRTKQADDDNDDDDDENDKSSLSLKRRVLSAASRLVKGARRSGSGANGSAKKMKKKPARTAERSSASKKGQSGKAGQRRRGREQGALLKSQIRTGRLRQKMNRSNLQHHMDLIKHGRYIQAEQSLDLPQADRRLDDEPAAAAADGTKSIGSVGATKAGGSGGEVKGGSSPAKGTKRPFYAKGRPTTEEPARKGASEGREDEEDRSEPGAGNGLNDDGGEREKERRIESVGSGGGGSSSAGEETDTTIDGDAQPPQPRRVGDGDVDEEEGDTVTVMPKFDGVDDDPEIDGDQAGDGDGTATGNTDERENGGPALSEEDEPRTRRVNRERPLPDDRRSSGGNDEGGDGSSVAGGGGIGATIGGGGAPSTGGSGSSKSDGRNDDEADEERGGERSEGKRGGGERVVPGVEFADEDDDDAGERSVKSGSQPTGAGAAGASGSKSGSAGGAADSEFGSRVPGGQGGKEDRGPQRTNDEHSPAVGPSTSAGGDDEANDVDYRDEMEEKERKKQEKMQPPAATSGHKKGSTGEKHCEDGSYDHHGDHDHHHHHDTIKWLQDAIPGEPNIDYPILSRANLTDFNCADQKYAGYYADVEARCQVFHICQADGRQDSFLCPNGTIFSQTTRVCVWWNSFACEAEPRRKRRASGRQAPPKLKSRRVSRNSRRRKLRHGIKPKRRA